MNKGLNFFTKNHALADLPTREAVCFEDLTQTDVWRVEIGRERVKAAMDELLAKRLALCWNACLGYSDQELESVVALGRKQKNPPPTDQ